MQPVIGIIRDPRYLDHLPGHTHPEHPSRLRAIYEMIDREFPEKLLAITPQPAAMDDLELVHTPAYIKKVLKTAEHQFTSLAPDTPASAKTYLAAWLAAGGCIEALKAVWSGLCRTCFALIRPPGHHALPGRAGGFCIFNNVAIAARYAQRLMGLERILVVDWDIHHGNGIHEFFYNDPGVFYFSSHDKLLYPYSGDFDEAGAADGLGYTVNVPLPRDLEDEDMLALYQTLLPPIVERYRPQLILVDAGFDAHRDDPIGRSHLTESVFADLTRLILHLGSAPGGPKTLFVLEGGYDPRALSRCVEKVLRVLCEPAAQTFEQVDRTARADVLAEEVTRAHKSFQIWVD